MSSGLRNLTEEEDSAEVYHVVKTEQNLSEPIYDRKEVRFCLPVYFFAH